MKKFALQPAAAQIACEVFLSLRALRTGISE
jgi:hypothetical protein